MNIQSDSFFILCVEISSFFENFKIIEIDLKKIKSTKLNSMKKQSRQFIYYMNIKYQQYNRHQQRTLENEVNWLNSQAFSIEINESELVKKLNIELNMLGLADLNCHGNCSRRGAKIELLKLFLTKNHSVSSFMRSRNQRKKGARV